MIYVKGKPEPDSKLVKLDELTRVTTLNNRVLNIREKDLFPTVAQGKNKDTVLEPESERWVQLDEYQRKEMNIFTDEKEVWVPRKEVPWGLLKVTDEVLAFCKVNKSIEYYINEIDLVKYVNPNGLPIDYDNIDRLLKGQQNDILLAMKIIERSNLYKSIGSIPMVIAQNYANIKKYAKITPKVKRMLRMLGMDVNKDGREGILVNYLEAIRYVNPDMYKEAFNLLCNVRRS
jgi:hypothetical protein